MNCIFSDPVIWNGASTTRAMDPFAFKNALCSDATTTTGQSIEITNGSSTFYLNKEISYGDLFFVFFATVFTLFFIFDFLYRFIFKIKVNFRH